jgi:dihydrofolate synthase/folylpolyglutamate synthase
MDKACQLLHYPQKAYPTIHVAGTNGKGSVATKIAKTFQCAGYRVGLYTSPHLLSPNERIQINGTPIGDLHLTRHLPPHLTFFEAMTLLAFLYFQEQKVDIAVIEVGLGGRLDATNVIAPLLSIITSIGFDHKERLGSTLHEIALEKYGIAKPKIPLIIGPTVPSIPQPDTPIYSVPPTSSCLYDDENQAIAELALRHLSLSFSLPLSAIQSGLLVKPKGRLERLAQHTPPLYFDAAHNPPAFKALIRALTFLHPNTQMHWILALSKDKEITECAKIISPHAASIRLPHIPHPRVAPPSTLASLLLQSHIDDTYADAYAALSNMPPSDIILVTGSFFILKEAYLCHFRRESTQMNSKVGF